MANHSDIRSVDFIIYTGDTARHDRDGKQDRTAQDVYEDHQLGADYFTKTFDFSRPEFKLFPTIGNNDPGNKIMEQ